MNNGFLLHARFRTFTTIDYSREDDWGESFGFEIGQDIVFKV